MIQPLKSAPSVWSLVWVDLPEPLPVEEDFFLPTILLLVGPSFEPLVAPEIFRNWTRCRRRSGWRVISTISACRTNCRSGKRRSGWRRIGNFSGAIGKQK